MSPTSFVTLYKEKVEIPFNLHCLPQQLRVLVAREEGLPDRSGRVQGAARPPLPPAALPRLPHARLQEQGGLGQVQAHDALLQEAQ